MQVLRWLRPSVIGAVDRATYRLRIVLSVQVGVFGLVTYLVLSLGESSSVGLALPELIAHLLLAFFLWTNRITWSTVLPVAALGVVGLAIGEGPTVEILAIFFIIPLVLPFYSSTTVALTTQILVWIMLAGAGSSMAIMAPDRMPWTALVIEVSAIALVGTLMVIFRYSLLRLTGANRRLENTLAQYRLLYDAGPRTTLVLTETGHISEVHGASTEMLGLPQEELVGRHYSSLTPAITGPRDKWEVHLRSDGKPISYDSWVNPNGGSWSPVHVLLLPGTPRQRAAGVALLVEIQMSPLSDVPGDTGTAPGV